MACEQRCDGIERTEAKLVECIGQVYDDCQGEIESLALASSLTPLLDSLPLGFQESLSRLPAKHSMSLVIA